VGRGCPYFHRGRSLGIGPMFAFSLEFLKKVFVFEMAEVGET